MRRRDLLASLGAALVARPVAATAQQSMPVVGFLRSTPAAPFVHLAVALRQGLAEAGFVEGRNVAIEYRYADNRPERLPDLAAELVRRDVDVIVGNSLAAEAAKAATSTVPIVFVTSDDPVTRGLVRSLSRPGGNVTGLTFFGGGQLGAKRLQLLHEMSPGARTIAYLLDPHWPASPAELSDVEAAGRALGLRLMVLEATNMGAIEAAFQKMGEAGAGALMVSGAPFFTSERRRLVALAARHRIPAIYDVRDHEEEGGLVSYGASFTGAYRQAGLYAGRILQGTAPAELPVLQPTQFELVLNLKTAKALGLSIAESILGRADEVIE